MQERRFSFYSRHQMLPYFFVFCIISHWRLLGSNSFWCQNFFIYFYLRVVHQIIHNSINLSKYSLFCGQFWTNIFLVVCERDSAKYPSRNWVTSLSLLTLFLNCIKDKIFKNREMSIESFMSFCTKKKLYCFMHI